MGSDFAVAVLGDLVDDIIDRRGVTPLKLGSDFTSSGNRVISAKVIKGGRVDLDADSPRYVDSMTYAKWMKSPLLADDVLLTSEAPLGEVAWLDRNRDWVLGQRLFGIRPHKQRLAGRYLYYALQYPEVIGDLHGRATGTTVLGIRQTQLRKVAIPVPPLDEQRRIAAVLGALDDKIELNRKMNRTLEAMAQALFKSWFIDFDGVPDSDLVESELGPIPKGWAVESLDGVADFLNGAACQKYPAAEGEESLPVIKIRELNQGVTAGTERATATIPQKWWVDNGDVLFSWSGSLVVKVWTGGRGALNQHLFKVTSARFPRWFFLLWTRFHLQDFQRIAADKATTMGHIKRHHLTDARCLVPSDSAMARFDEIMSPLVDKQVACEQESQTLATLRDTLLPKLISGEVRVPEAETAVEAVL